MTEASSYAYYLVRDKICDDGESSKRLREDLLRAEFDCWGRMLGLDVMLNWVCKESRDYIQILH